MVYEGTEMSYRPNEGVGARFYLRPPMLLPPPPPKLPPPPPKLLPLPPPEPKLLLLLPPLLLPMVERVVVDRVEGVVRVVELRVVLPELLKRVVLLGVNVLSRETLPPFTLPRVVVLLCPKLREGR